MYRALVVSVLLYGSEAWATTACHPPSLFEESVTSSQTSMAGRDLQAAPKLDGPIQSSTTSILLASTPPMLPRWSLIDSSGRPLLADCQRSNPSKALKSSQVSQLNSVLTGQSINLRKYHIKISYVIYIIIDQ